MLPSSPDCGMWSYENLIIFLETSFFPITSIKDDVYASANQLALCIKGGVDIFNFNVCLGACCWDITLGD